MSYRILHISHHIGCFRDQEYILNMLGFKVKNLKFYDNQFTVTKDIAKKFWEENKDLINTFDYVLISDTSSISRCIFENISEFKSKLIIWICNRFDFGMNQESEFYELFNKYKTHDRVRVIGSTFWEKIWCLRKGIDILDCEIINPLGKYLDKLDSNIPKSKVFDEYYNNNSNITEADLFVPFYHNDNIFFNLKNFLESKKFKVCNTTFKNTNELKTYKTFITQPDTFCKWFSFEAIHIGLPVILPSAELLIKLCKSPGYLYNMTGYGGAENMTEDLIKIGEWYNPKFKNLRFYFDSYNEIPDIIKSINKFSLKEDFLSTSMEHEFEILNKWRNLYETF